MASNKKSIGKQKCPKQEADVLDESPTERFRSKHTRRSFLAAPTVTVAKDAMPRFGVDQTRDRWTSPIEPVTNEA
jgi:hypothetical protein